MLWALEQIVPQNSGLDHLIILPMQKNSVNFMESSTGIKTLWIHYAWLVIGSEAFPEMASFSEKAGHIFQKPYSMPGSQQMLVAQ